MIPATQVQSSINMDPNATWPDNDFESMICESPYEAPPGFAFRVSDATRR
jgi:hypothetical protein